MKGNLLSIFFPDNYEQRTHETIHAMREVPLQIEACLGGMDEGRLAHWNLD
jgi:hypothetical protein